MTTTDGFDQRDLVKIIRNCPVEELEAFLKKHPHALHENYSRNVKYYTGIFDYLVRFGDLEKVQLTCSLGGDPGLENNLLTNVCCQYESHKDYFKELLVCLFPDGLDFPYEDRPDYFINMLTQHHDYNRHTRLLKFLIGEGLDIRKMERCAGYGLITSALRGGFSTKLINQLINAKCTIQRMPRDPMSPLLLALSQNHELLPKFKELGAELGVSEDEALTHIPTDTIDVELLDSIFPQPCYKAVKNEFGATAMHKICQYGEAAHVDYLITKQLPLDSADNDGETPLHYAVQNSNIGMITHLAKLGVDLNAKLNDGQTAVDLASGARVRKKLLSLGAQSSSDINGDNAIDKIRKLLAQDEPWAIYLTKRLEDCDQTTAQSWLNILELCEETTATKPTKTWQKKMDAMLVELNQDEFYDLVRTALSAVKEKRHEVHDWDTVGGHYCGANVAFFIGEKSTHIIKALVWACASQSDADTCRILRYLATDMYKKVYGVGMRNAKIANAALLTLATMENDAGLKDIIAIRSTTKYNPAFTHIERIFSKLAEERGVSTLELAETSIPDYGLTDIGLYEVMLDENFRATLSLTGVGKTELLWNKQDKTQKTLPAEVKVKHPEPVKRIKALAKDLQQASRAHCQRLEGLYFVENDLSYDEWEKKYLNHKLIGTLARSLIWRFNVGNKSVDGVFTKGKIQDINHKDIPNLEKATVSLWHPIDSKTREIVSWRGLLASLEVTQPFKQAHREIYHLTDAEKETGTYSNRYANQVLLHGQFNALATQRRWGQTRGGSWDGGQENSAYRSVNGIDVEFEAEGSDEYGYTSHGIYQGVTTGAVRFYKDSKPQNLVRIDTKTFSEIMRDVDLFVGVSNFGNVPNPQDYLQHHRYWDKSSFGELNQTAQTRKEVLESVIKRMKCSDRLSIKGRFLHVRGNIRNYKIHLGSTNILMEPDDSYLCIVPKPSRARTNIKLPFEGDQALSQIISKAIMLASDDKIKDSSITSQITRIDHAS